MALEGILMTVEEMVLILTKARIRKGWSQRKAAARCGYPPMTFWCWEAGTRLPNIIRFIDWAETMGFEVIIRRKYD
jgi:transcriptional regulator with XRE-family HTH domain